MTEEVRRIGREGRRDCEIVGFVECRRASVHCASPTVYLNQRHRDETASTWRIRKRNSVVEMPWSSSRDMKRARPWVSRFRSIWIARRVLSWADPRLEGPLASQSSATGANCARRRRLIIYAAFCRPITSPCDRGREFLDRAALPVYILFYFDSNIVVFDLVHLYPWSRYSRILSHRDYIGIRSVLDTRTDIRSYFLFLQSASSILRSFDIFLQRR